MVTKRHTFGIMVCTLIILLVCGCGAKTVSKGDAPCWYLNPPESDKIIYGTGSSEKTQSLELAKQVADANARTDLANTIQVSVQNMVRTFLQQSGTMEASRALQFSETVGKQVVDIQLAGVKVTKREIKDGRCFSLAEVSMDSMKQALLNAVRDTAAQLAEEKAKSAFKDLESEVSKGNIPIVKQ
jgi:hypothetical protein